MLSADARRILHIIATVAAATIVLGTSRLPSQAQTNHMLVIPASDGYGFDDCLAGNKACGHTIADAWCEAHGMAAAASFGRAEDITASLTSHNSAVTSNRHIDESAFIVNCRD